MLAGAQTLRVVAYNIDADTSPTIGAMGGPISGPGIETVLQAIGNATLGGNAQPIDVLALEELAAAPFRTIDNAAMNGVLNKLNAIYGAGTYAWDLTSDARLSPETREPGSASARGGRARPTPRGARRRSRRPCSDAERVAHRRQHVLRARARPRARAASAASASSALRSARTRAVRSSWRRSRLRVDRLQLDPLPRVLDVAVDADDRPLARLDLLAASGTPTPRSRAARSPARPPRRRRRARRSRSISFQRPRARARP